VLVVPYVLLEGDTPNPCIRRNGEFSASTICSRSPTAPDSIRSLHGPTAHRRHRGAVCYAARQRAVGERSVVHVAQRRSLCWGTSRSRVCSRSANSRRTIPCRAAPRRPSPRARADEPEACFLAGDDYLAFPPRGTACPPARRDRRRGMDRTGHAHRRVGFIPASAAGSVVVASGPALRSSTPTLRRTRSEVRSARPLARRRVRASGRLYLPVARPEVQSPVPARRRPRAVVGPPEVFESGAGQPVYGVGAVQASSSLRRRRRLRLRTCCKASLR